MNPFKEGDYFTASPSARGAVKAMLGDKVHKVRRASYGSVVPEGTHYLNGDRVVDGIGYEQLVKVPAPAMQYVASMPSAITSPSTAEQDPNGTDPHAPGAKLDAGKVMAGQILGQFPRALLGVAEVGTFGAKKYTMGGWLKVPNAIARYADAGIRHWLARLRGEELDPDSKLSHLKHQAWNILAELELTLIEQEKKKK